MTAFARPTPATPGAPSVEDILESIKKVIARDSLSETRRPAPGTPAGADDVLELSEIAAQILGEPSPTAAPAASARTATPEPLLPPRSTAAMRESLAALAVLSQPGAPPQIVRSGETSLEGLVRDLLRPMLAQWLETHLPVLVEQLVAAEIARITGKK